jgi:mannitol-1-/sugar-/sorbitol-6-phosphatase
VKSSRSFGCKAILFDLDGVLVNSAECVERTWRAWAARHNLDPEKIIAYAHGRRTIETVQLVAPELSADEELRTLESSEAMTAEGVYEVEGARELLESLPRDRWAIVTSGVRPVAEFRIRLTGLPSASVMICADDISRGKPDPEGYLKAAAGLRQSAADCIVIEDAPAGIEAAHNGGMRAIGIASTYSTDRLSTADAVVQRLSDLAIVCNGAQILIAVPSHEMHAS